MISKTQDTVQTFYARDATGNILSTYTYRDTSVNSGQLSQIEANLYGPSRLGMTTLATNVQDAYNSPLYITDPLGDDPGDYHDKQGNHLGKDNVQDDKVYITDKATIASNTTQGKTDWTKVQQAPATVDFTKTYAITNSQLLDRANWIYAEGRGSVPLYYAYAIQNSRILNKTEAKVYYWGLQDSEGRLDKNQYFQGTSHSENKNGKAF